MFLLFKWVFFGFHVSFLGCTSYVHHSLDSLEAHPQISPRKSAGNKGRDELAAKGPRKQATQKTKIGHHRNVSPCGRGIFPWKNRGGKEDESVFYWALVTFQVFVIYQTSGGVNVGLSVCILVGLLWFILIFFDQISGIWWAIFGIYTVWPIFVKEHAAVRMVQFLHSKLYHKFYLSLFEWSPWILMS